MAHAYRVVVNQWFCLAHSSRPRAALSHALTKLCEQDAGTLARALDWDEFVKVFAAIRNHWMIALAIYPLVRFLLLAEPPAEMSDIQLAERFMWLSIWPIEIAVIAAAGASGFSLGATVRSFGPRTKALIGAWLVALAWSSLSASVPLTALRGVIEWLMHGCVALAIWHLLSRREDCPDRQIDLFARLAPWVAIAVGGACLALIYRIGLDSGYPFGTEPPGFAHLRHTGYLFAPAMILSIVQIAARPERSWPATLALALNAALCLWFGSRGPFFGVGCGLIAAFLLFPDFRRPALIARVGGATAVGAVLSVVVPSPPNSGFNAVMRLFRSSADPTAFSSGRLTFWKETAAHILDKPLFGHGAGQFQQTVSIAQGIYRHPHDFVLQVIFDWGFVGGGAFLALLGLALAGALRRTRLGAVHGELAMFGAVSMLAFALIDGILFYPYTILVTLVFLTLPFRNAVGHRAERGPTLSPAMGMIR